MEIDDAIMLIESTVQLYEAQVKTGIAEESYITEAMRVILEKAKSNIVLEIFKNYERKDNDMEVSE